MQLTLVGTGHIFAIGDMVDRIIRERDPDVVCVELDPVRLRGLEERRQLTRLEAAGDPRAAEMRAAQKAAHKRMPFVYRFLAGAQERLAAGEGVEPGSEMLAAVDAARRIGRPIGCIDVDARVLVRRVWKEMPMRERLRFLFAMVRGGGRSDVDEEITEYERDPIVYIAKMGDRFPTLKRVLIDERDSHMATRILSLGGPERNVSRVVAVVGDGHVSGMLRGLGAGIPSGSLEVVRMRSLREKTVPDNPFGPRTPPQDDAGDGSSVSFGFDVPMGPDA